MKLPQRIAGFGVLGMALALFWFAPSWFALDETGMTLRAAFAQLGGPMLGCVLCAVAAYRSAGSIRRAWRNFAIACGLYLGGNLGYLAMALAGITPPFPSLPEAAFFLMASFFATGMLQFSQTRNRVSPIHIYNFALIYAAVALASLFFLYSSIEASVMQPLATAVAFLYPALWFSVAAFGIASLFIYVHGNRSFAFGLMVIAVVAEGAADFRYAIALMEGSYELGGITQLLWVASGLAIIWAAIEQIVSPSSAEEAAPQTRRSDRSVAQAMLPAAAVGAILVSAAFSGILGHGTYAGFGAILAVAFALVAGFREHWIISTQRRLRLAVEQSREELAGSRRQLVAVLESTHDSVLVLDRDWNVTYFNHNAAETIDQRDKLRIGISVWELFPAALSSGEGDYYKRAVETRHPEEFEIFVEDRQLWLGISAYPSDDGLSIFFRDISDAKLARDRIVHLAHHDALTGLANRTLFQTKLSEAAEADETLTLLLLDLDHFKEVNDTLGHPVGDALLRSTSQRLRDCLGEDVTIGRLGGDEFAAILTGDLGVADVEAIADHMIDEANRPHMIDGHAVRVGASIGIAMSQTPGKAMDELLRDADIALYAAKTDARGSYRFFEPSMQVAILNKQALRSDLAGALERGEFSLVYQPQVDLHTDRVSGFEALLRWNHPTRGLVSPDDFIPLAEETGSIIEIGEWVLRKACAEAMKWPEDVSIAVNLSSRQFGNDDLAQIVKDALHDTGLTPARLELEITETVLMRDSNINLLTLGYLRMLGVKIALDDFGTGFSSLGYLQRFPFSKIKIDRSFISGLPGSEESQAIVRSVMGLGQSLGMRVTAEGVETVAQLEWVRNGCDEAQGYLLSRPVPAEQALPIMERLNGLQRDRMVG